MAKKQPQKDSSKTVAAATETATSKKTNAKKDKKQRKPMPKALRVLFAPFTAFGRYVKGSWKELREVRWPNRKATWALTLAVLLFTAFFVIIILALDSAFQALFNRILL